MGKIMITGALSNVGGYVAKYAIENGQDVVCADIDIQALNKKFGDKTKNVYFDFTDAKTFKDALDGVDRVFIMRPPHLGKPEDLKPFIDILKDIKHIRLVSFLSLIGIERNPIPPHYKIEKYIEKAELPFCHIRPSFFMQNISGVHAFEIKEFNRIVVPVKKALTSFIDAEDIGEITAKVLSEPEKHKNKGYSITGGEAIDYNEVAKILSEELGREITYANLKPSLAKQYWIQIRGLDKEYSTVMEMLYMMTRMGTAKKVTTVYKDIMNKEPQTFRQFVRKNIKSWI
ncbi:MULTISPECIES: NmrA family NAD(P)-binding protein [Clostridium]|uniref:NmrA family NAD(P)-binding protein n=1 Tax=Clostridium TaxID=1485 RepID=UPI0011C9566B|nr:MULTISPECIES: NmrA family NAD(P)-binding protein [Clostridium]MBS7129913.1 NmrA family NAD(P)-binding protein [Clostridium sp.]MDU1822926.1 NmrA family NAD(P)-binding protein [Clostridium sp.]MDU1840289.1 NmrA family NAD(P)-binding protein [Clostridium sp.]MDU2283308.1 NmrA family NAD(P)-binding protein [Clostridium sp.]MDU2690317.1 NmrA family NAD(P)-binding protein [Clostridium sp.]